MEKRNNKFIVLFMSDRMCVYHVVSFGSLESLKVKISKLVRSVFFRANLSPYTSIFEMSSTYYRILLLYYGPTTTTSKSENNFHQFNIYGFVLKIDDVVCET